jgi:phage shock protein A
MSVMKRVTLIFRSKANKALDRMEDPRETLDYSYQRQLEMLQKVRRGVADVATSRKRVELQMNQIQQQSTKLEKQARDALGAGREDLAREALSRRSSAQSQLGDLQAQYASLQAEEEKLTVASQRLQSRVDAFRTRKETIKATYTAAEAQTRINEAFSGISEEMGDVGMAIQRAEDKTAQMQARAGAIDELLASGALDDVSGTPRDDIQAELDRMGSGNDVELELQKLKGEIGGGSTPELEAGAARDGAAAPGPAQQSAAGRPASAAPAGESAIPSSDVGESAIPSSDPKAGDGT